MFKSSKSKCLVIGCLWSLSFAYVAHADVTDSDYVNQLPEGSSITLKSPVNFRPNRDEQTLQNGAELEDGAEPLYSGQAYCDIFVKTSDKKDRSLLPREMVVDTAHIYFHDTGSSPSTSGRYWATVNLFIKKDSAVSRIDCSVMAAQAGSIETIGGLKAALQSAGMTLNLSKPIAF